jgi:hypothetical protein
MTLFYTRNVEYTVRLNKLKLIYKFSFHIYIPCKLERNMSLWILYLAH